MDNDPVVRRLLITETNGKAGKKKKKKNKENGNTYRFLCNGNGAEGVDLVEMR